MLRLVLFQELRIGHHELKLGQHCAVEGPSFTALMNPPAEDARPELQLGDNLECLDALQGLWQIHAAAEREDEGRILYVFHLVL